MPGASLTSCLWKGTRTSPPTLVASAIGTNVDLVPAAPMLTSAHSGHPDRSST
jgi:hypothetical protein